MKYKDKLNEGEEAF